MRKEESIEMHSNHCREGVQRQKEKLAERHEAVKVVVPFLGLTALAFAVLGYLVLQTNGFTH